MGETKQVDNLKAIAEAEARRVRAEPRPAIATVRVSAGPYFALAFVLTFSSALLVRVGYDALALFLLVVAWVAVPLLAFNERIAFDGVLLRRQGLSVFFRRMFRVYPTQLAVTDFETVETSAVRTLRRGGSVRYRYRTEITGKGRRFVLASGGRSYRKLVRELFPLIHEDKLDNRSRDLRDYLNDPKFLDRKTELSQLAPENVLDLAKSDFKLGGKSTDQTKPDASAEDVERAHLLRRLGNELRVSGRLREAGEAFRRSLNVTPRRAWLIYDFARLLRSQASANSDARLLSRARAALRLAGSRAGNDLVLLPLIGESLLECGDARQARMVLRRTVDIDNDNYKARLGLADLALREGKLAHVIHHYHEAARVGSDQALARYARREAEYYGRLNDDEEYLATELRRINWLQTVTTIRRLSARVTNVALLLALLGGYVDAALGSVGWSIATSSLIIWIATLLSSRFLFERSKPRSIA